MLRSESCAWTTAKSLDKDTLPEELREAFVVSLIYRAARLCKSLDRFLHFRDDWWNSVDSLRLGLCRNGRQSNTATHPNDAEARVLMALSET